MRGREEEEEEEDDEHFDGEYSYLVVEDSTK